MSTRTDPPKPMFGHDPGMSPGMQAPQRLAVSPPPKPAEGLPAAYGEPALELLVVDPANLFVSWEITAGQLSTAEAALGSAFGSRRLVVEIADAGEPGTVLGSSELFGEVGRWFLSVPPVGRMVQAKLYFETDNQRFDLRSAGPVALPRVSPVEPESFEELHVSYAFGAGGHLSLAGTKRATPGTAPELGIDPSLQDVVAASLSQLTGASPAPWSTGWTPSSSSIPGAQDD